MQNNQSMSPFSGATRTGQACFSESKEPMTLPMQALSSGRETMPLISTLHPTVSGAGEQGACSELLSMQFSFEPALRGGQKQL